MVIWLTVYLCSLCPLMFPTPTPFLWLFLPLLNLALHICISLLSSPSIASFSLSLCRPRSFFSLLLPLLMSLVSSHLLPSHDPLLPNFSLPNLCPSTLPSSIPRLPSSLPLVSSLPLPSRALQCWCVGDDVRDAAAGVSNSRVYIRVLQPCGLQPLSGWRQRWEASAQHTQ